MANHTSVCIEHRYVHRGWGGYCPKCPRDRSLEYLWPGLTAPAKDDNKGWRKLAAQLKVRQDELKEAQERDVRNNRDASIRYHTSVKYKPPKKERMRPAKRKSQAKNKEFWDALTD